MDSPVCYRLGTPLGEIGVVAEGGVPCAIAFGCEGLPLAPGEEPPPAVEEVLAALRAYFSGEDTGTELARRLIARQRATTFARRVLEEVARIPRGETASYGEIAARAGNARAARAVGSVMRSNPFPIIIPCHRVVKGNGGIGGYGGREDIKAWLLRFEGAPGFSSVE